MSPAELWNVQPIGSDDTSPEDVLWEFARALGPQTNGFVVGQVVSGDIGDDLAKRVFEKRLEKVHRPAREELAVENEPNYFAALDLLVPNLNGYRHRLLWVRFSPFDLYPAFLFLPDSTDPLDWSGYSTSEALRDGIRDFTQGNFVATRLGRLIQQAKRAESRLAKPAA